MLKHLTNKYLSHESEWYIACERISRKNYFTNVYGLARSTLALSILIPLIFDSKYIIFPKHLLEINIENAESILELINIFFLFDYENFYIAKLLSIVILCSVIYGVQPKITGILHWWITFSFFKATGLPEGGDQINSIITFLLIPITLMDSRKNHWQSPTNTNIHKNFIAYLIFLLIQIQMAVIYFHAATEKIYKLDLWLDGTAVYYWLNDNVFGMTNWLSIIVNPIINIPYLLALLTWGVFTFELILSAALFMSPNRKIILLKYAIFYHFSIIVFHGLVSFFFAMTGGLILYLIQKDKELKLSFIKKIWSKISVSFKNR
jgi:antimicrobial peptide system SdpB family protein